MSETPNDNPDKPEGTPGYWESQSGSTPPPPPTPPYPGPQFNPQTAYPADGSTPPPPTYGQPYPQQPGYGQPYPQQPSYGQPYPQQGYGYPQYGPPQDHPQATTAMIIGLISVIGGFICALPLLAAPFAWWIGNRARKEIDREPGRYGGRGQATAGFVLGIIGTALLVLAIIGIIIFIIIVANDPYTYEEF